MGNKFLINEKYLKKFSTYNGILMQGMINGLLEGKIYTVRSVSYVWYKLVPHGNYFSAYKIQG